MDKIYFTSDTHFGHTNILRFGKGRPFEDINEHDEMLIKNWNDRVGPGDRIYHLGDFSMSNPERIRSILERLNGQIFIIRGNHDKNLRGDKTLNHVIWIKDYFKLKVPDEGTVTGKQEIVLSHFPFEVWDKRHYGSWHLHGHCHGNLPSPEWQPRLDVGVDNCNFAPISYEEVKKVMKAKTFKPLDHHSDKRKGKKDVY